MSEPAYKRRMWCSLVPRRFASFPEGVKSREQGLTTTLTEVIFYNEGIYFFALSPGSCLVVVSRLSFLIDPGAAGCVVGSLPQRQSPNRQG